MSEKKHKSIPSSRSDCHQPFGKGLILQAVEKAEDGLSRKKACASYGMAYSTLTEWMAQRGSDGYHAKKSRLFSPAKKKYCPLRSAGKNDKKGSLSVVFGTKLRG